MRHRVEKALGGALRVLHGGPHHLRAPAAAAGPGKQQQGAVAPAAQGIVAGSKHGMQRFAGQRLFLGGRNAAPGIGAAGLGQQLPDGGVAAGIGISEQLMRLGQYRQALQQGIQAGSAELALGLQAHQFQIQRQRQLPFQTLVRGPLRVIHHELYDRGLGQGQGKGLAIAQFEPGGPVADGGAIAGGGVGGTAFAQQAPHRGVGLRVQRLRIQQGKRSQQFQRHSG
ncbi:hypothetical protein D3C85_1088230 [compost metagenome]